MIAINKPNPTRPTASKFGAPSGFVKPVKVKEASATEQAAVLKPLIRAEVAALESRGVNKIVLMTHLQDSAIEQELIRQLVADGVGVDVVIGGGQR